MRAPHDNAMSFQPRAQETALSCGARRVVLVSSLALLCVLCASAVNWLYELVNPRIGVSSTGLFKSAAALGSMNFTLTSWPSFNALTGEMITRSPGETPL